MVNSSGIRQNIANMGVSLVCLILGALVNTRILRRRGIAAQFRLYFRTVFLRSNPQTRRAVGRSGAILVRSFRALRIKNGVGLRHVSAVDSAHVPEHPDGWQYPTTLSMAVRHEVSCGKVELTTPPGAAFAGYALVIPPA